MKLDSRYKVNNDLIERMRSMRDQGMTYKGIADEIGFISWATVQYWCSASVRHKARKRNAKRTYTPEQNKARAQRDLSARKKRFARNPEAKLKHAIRSALADNRIQRRSVHGIPIEECKKILEK